MPGLSYQMWALGCSIWDLVPWPGIEPGPSALEAQNLNHWTTRKVPYVYFRLGKWCYTKSKFERFSYSSSKWVIKQWRQFTTYNAFGPGIANECTVQWWFKKFCKEDKSLEDEERSGRPSEVDKHATTMANWEDRQGSSCYNHTRSGQRPQRQPFYRSALETNRKGEKAQ